MEQTDIYLVSSPNRNIDYPALSIPTLYAKLQKEFKVKQRDINVTIRDSLFTADVLNCIKNIILPELIYEFSSQKEILSYFVKLYNYLIAVDKLWRLENIERIKVLMQNREYERIIADKEGAEGIQAIFKLNKMFHLFIEFYASHSKFISDSFMRNIGYDPILQIVNDLRDEIIASDAAIVGFSVLEIQRNFTLMVIRMLKEKDSNGRFFGGKIVVGGADPTRYKEKYLQYFSEIDFALMYEGEINFPSLVREIKSGGADFSSIKNIIYRKDGEIYNNYDPLYKIKSSEISTPDFTGYRLEKYLTPALPLHASRACYYAVEKKQNCLLCSKYNISCNGAPNLGGCDLEENGCNFCVHYKTYSNYIERNVNEVVDDVQLLNQAYGVSLFHFTDDALKPELGTAISKEILRRGIRNIRWLVYARFEPSFNFEILQLWYNAGARVIEWGLESASQHVIDGMNKHIQIDDVRRILEESSRIGIVNKLFLFHNHPRETLDDLKETLDFLLELSKREQIRLFPVVRNKMYLLKGTTVFDNWEKFYRKVWEPSGEFSITAAYLEFEPYQAKAEMVEKFVTQIRAMMKTKFIYSTDDENVMFDLLTIQMNEQGICTYYQC